MYWIIPFIAHWIYSLIIIIPGILIQLKLYKNIKNEEHLEKGKVIQRILKTYSIVQCIGWPLCFVLSGILLLENPIWEIANVSFMYYLLSFYAFISTCMRNFAAFNSLIVAVSRYIFIVFTYQADSFGIKKLRHLFITGRLAVPVCLALLGQCITSTMEWMSLIGFPDDIARKLVNTSFNSHPGQAFVAKDTVIYSTVNTHFPAVLVVAMKITYHISFLILYSNIAEAFIYAHTFIFSLR